MMILRAVAVPVLLAALLGAGQAQSRWTNVVVIFADDLGYGDLSCYGHPKFRTPHLDRMAEEGVRLTQFQVSCPYCAPSRTALLTGRYQFRSGMTMNPFPIGDMGGAGGRNDSAGIPASEVTLGEAFQAAGFRTIHVGKWHLGHKPRFYPTRNGFHEYYGILYSNDMHPVELFDGEEIVEYPVVQATLTKRYTERAVKFMEANRSKPFFVYFAHAMPHKPLACSEAFYGRSGNGLYADVIAEVDWSVGRILGTLKELGLDRNTLVIFTSDNGPWFGGSTGGLRGMKGWAYEGGIRVPMIARWPGRIPAGRVVSEPAIIMDLYPTALKAAGIAPPGDRVLDGKDILPLLRGEAKSPHEALFAMRSSNLYSVRSGKWKLVLRRPGRMRWRPGEAWKDPRGPDGVRILAPFEQAHPRDFPGVKTGDEFKGPQLFDLSKDAAEQRDVAADHPEVVARLRKHADWFESEQKQAKQD